MCNYELANRCVDIRSTSNVDQVIDHHVVGISVITTDDERLVYSITDDQVTIEDREVDLSETDTPKHSSSRCICDVTSTICIRYCSIKLDCHYDILEVVTVH